MKIKKLFETPKKAVATSACVIAILAVFGTGTVFAASAIAEGSSIGADNAKNFAFADAGVDPNSAQFVKTEFDFEHGQFVYEVEFTADGVEYEYWIKASDGSVVKKEQEIIKQDGQTEIATAAITFEEAKQAALADAGVAASEVTFTKAKLDVEDGVSVYEIEFYVGTTEYEYEINAVTGAVHSKSVEIKNPVTVPGDGTTGGDQQGTVSGDSQQGSTGNDGQQGTSAGNDQSGTSQSGQNDRITLDEAKNVAITDAKVSASEVTYTKAKLDYDDGMLLYEIEFYTSAYEYDYEINAVTGAVYKRSAERFQNGSEGGTGATGAYIGIDQAKAIALEHAGLSSSEVIFSKAKLDKDDGMMIYEIEFYKGMVEYEYEISATTGAVLEFDSEIDD